MSEISQETEIKPPKREIAEKLLTRRALKKSYRRRLGEAVEEAQTDALTGLPTRNAFERRLHEEVLRLKRGKNEKTTIMVLDADKLKQINDTKGHAGGDIYLKSIADALRSGVRRELDFVARTGGDEFILIMPKTDLIGAETMWEKTLNPSFLQNGIAISAGAAELDPNNPDQSVKDADSAMYGAKQDKDRNGENLLFSYVTLKK